jgi:hypothetical protein
MKNTLLAIALTVALPAMASAQAVAAAPKAPCCKRMAGANHDHHAKAGADPHAGHDMSKMDPKAHGAKAVADPHAGHDMTRPMVKTPAPRATPSN